ncbi:hypothetical protein SteCoe_14946 [Stentor coeruleus]|uniref:EF-hand domain-containing protein n=1 Tax=Stentor coeruleus TaxID=5963 RepID=A0A1R2C4S0_9CILI|nr:hypothetical protein SteCoe_14946 [Stentor coeruleus]
MENDFSLFDLNREKLKRIFLKLTKNEKRVNFIDFQRLCLNGKLIPVKTIQAFVSQNQLRAIAGKFGNASCLPKLFLNFDQFEQFLKIISINKSQPQAKAEKVKVFFSFLSQGLRTDFTLNANENGEGINRSNTSYSQGSNSELNESNNCLDLSIKEALNTLKKDTKRPTISPSRVALSPRIVGRVYSNPSTPKSRSHRGFGTEATGAKIRVSLLDSQGYRNSIKGKKIGVELDEFLETEKLVQKEVMSIKVNLKNNPRKPEIKPVSRYSGVKVLDRGRTIKEDPRLVKERQMEKAIATLTNSIKKYRKFVLRIKANSFCGKFVVGVVFRVWRLASKNYESKD